MNIFSLDNKKSFPCLLLFIIVSYLLMNIVNFIFSFFLSGMGFDFYSILISIFSVFPFVTISTAILSVFCAKKTILLGCILFVLNFFSEFEIVFLTQREIMEEYSIAPDIISFSMASLSYSIVMLGLYFLSILVSYIISKNLDKNRT